MEKSYFFLIVIIFLFAGPTCQSPHPSDLPVNEKEEATHTGDHDTVVARLMLEEGFNLMRAGEISRAISRFSEADSVYQRVLKVDDNIPNREKRILAKIGQADCNRILAEFRVSTRLFEETLQLAMDQLPEGNAFTGRCYMGLGTIAGMKGDFQKGIKYNKQALKLFLQHPEENADWVAKVYNNTGSMISDQGDFEAGIYYYQKSLAVKEQQRGKENPNTWSTYYNIGDSYFKMGDYPKALAYFNIVKRVIEKSFSANLPIRCYGFIPFGALYHSNGQVKESEQAYRQAIECYENLEEPDSVHLAEAILGVGKALEAQDKFANARIFFSQALSVNHALYGNKHRQISETWQAFAEVSLKEGNLSQALEEIQMALTSFLPGFNNIDPAVNPPVKEMLNVDVLIFELLSAKANILEQAYRQTPYTINYFERSFEVYNLMFDLIEQARLGYNTSESKHFLGENAFRHYERALAIALELVEKTGDLKYYKEGFEIAERTKAAVLVESLIDADAKISVGVPEDVIEKGRSLQAELGYYKRLIFEEEQKGEEGDLESLKKWRNQVFDINLQREGFLQELEKDYPQYYDLKYQAFATSVEDVQQWLPNEHTTLMEYFLGDERIVIFAMNKQNFKVYQVNSPIQTLAAIDTLQSILSHAQQNGQKSWELFCKNSHLAYRQLLGPCLKDFVGNSLIVIPGGKLGYVPFELLLAEYPDAKHTSSYRNLPYLFLDYRFQYDYSATLLMMDWKRGKAEKPYAGFAPDYTASQLENTSALQHRKQADSSLEPLDHARQEVTRAAALFKTPPFLGRDATEQIFKLEAPNSAILHLAMHGVADRKEPLYSYLIFSEDPDRADDGKLFAYEIYNLPLKADLAVLSACNTGAGSELRSEGIMSLGRAFKYAGCPNVVMSLWTANDQSTSTIMEQFFKGLKAGKGKAEALHSARLKYLDIADERYTHPYYWGNFILLGDNEPLHGKRSSWLYWIVGIALIIFLWRLLKTIRLK